MFACVCLFMFVSVCVCVFNEEGIGWINRKTFGRLEEKCSVCAEKYKVCFSTINWVMQFDKRATDNWKTVQGVLRGPSCNGGHRQHSTEFRMH